MPCTDSFNQTLVPSQLGDLRRGRHTLRIRFISFWVARPRESSAPNHHPIQPHRSQRPTLFQRFPAPRSSWPRVAFPVTLYRGRIPDQNHLHYPMACAIPLRIRSSNTGPRTTTGLRLRPLFPAIHHGGNSPDRILLAGPSVDIRTGTIRIPAVDVHK